MVYVAVAVVVVVVVVFSFFSCFIVLGALCESIMIHVLEHREENIEPTLRFIRSIRSQYIEQ